MQMTNKGKQKLQYIQQKLKKLKQQIKTTIPKLDFIRLAILITVIFTILLGITIIINYVIPSTP